MKIKLYQLEEIEDTLRMMINYRRQLGHNESCMDRCIKKSYGYVTEILKSKDKTEQSEVNNT